MESDVSNPNPLEVSNGPCSLTDRVRSKLVVMVPTLNEERGLLHLIDNIQSALRKYNYAILVVDGHSTDETVRIARKKGASVIFQPNHGYGDALRAGFEYACDEMNAYAIVMVDGDGTYDPYDIPPMINDIISGKADLVVGNRFLRMDERSMPLINVIGNRILSTVGQLLLGVDIDDTQCGLRVMRADFARKIRIESDGMPFATEMLAKYRKAGARISQVPISYHVRHGRTKLKRFRDGFNILRRIFIDAMS